MDIFENGRRIGTMHAEPDGLYTLITCKTEPAKAVRRLYLTYPYASQYLGIPDESGTLARKIASKKLPKEFSAVAASHADAEYLPWCGVLDGIEVHDALISTTEILLPMEEAMNFPSWSFDTKTIDDKTKIVNRLNQNLFTMYLFFFPIASRMPIYINITGSKYITQEKR